MRHVERAQDGREGSLEGQRPRRLRGRGCALRDLHMRILYLIYCVDHSPLYLLACGLRQRKSASEKEDADKEADEEKER